MLSFWSKKENYPKLSPFSVGLWGCGLYACKLILTKEVGLYISCCCMICDECISIIALCTNCFVGLPCTKGENAYATIYCQGIIRLTANLYL